MPKCLRNNYVREDEGVVEGASHLIAERACINGPVIDLSIRVLTYIELALNVRLGAAIGLMLRPNLLGKAVQPLFAGF